MLQPFISTMQAISLFLALLCVYPSLHFLMVASQQHYSSSTNCSTHYAQNSGYQCEPFLQTCDTLTYFRAQPDRFSSLATIAEQLFKTSPSAIAQASSLSTLSPRLNPGEGLYIPLTCACNGTNFSSHSITYTVMPLDTIEKIATSTYEGLTTCQAMQDANPHLSPSNLKIGQKLTFPLRCACPSPAQTLRGINFLVTYPIGSASETVSSVVDMFGGLNETEFLLANTIVNTSTMLFAATTVLLPFKQRPTLPPNASTIPLIPSTRQDSIIVHIAAASATPVILIVAIMAAVFYTQKLKRKRAYRKTFLQSNAIASQNIASPNIASPNVLLRVNKKPSVDLSQVMSELASDSRLIVLSLDDIGQATEGFSESMRIKGAMYQGTFEGQSIAVKKVERDVTQEVRILQRLHHSNVISLLGVCIPSPYHSYLVYEYADGGSLHDWLHGHTQNTKSFKVLQWQERIQIAFDISVAMEYIHEHTNPQYVHNCINSSNILLDSKRRGKLANFSLAKKQTDLDVMCRTSIGLPTSRQHVGMENFLSQQHVKGVRVSPKVDVHAFGVVLLEMLFEKEDADGNVGAIRALLKGNGEEEKLRAWMYPGFDYDAHKDCAHALAMVAYSCIDPDPSSRPTARTVAFTLSKLLDACLSNNQSP